MKIKRWAFILIAIGFSNLSFSQDNDVFSKHSIGLEYQLFLGSPNIGITYRNYREGAKFNYRASLFMGGSNNYTFNNQQTDLFFRTNDSAVPFLGVNNSSLNNRSYRRLEIALERVKGYKNFDLISGFGINLGHVASSSFSSVYEAQEQEVIKNGITYYQLVNGNVADQENLNSLTSNINYLNAGLCFNTGLKFDIGKRLYCTTTLNLRANVQWTLSEKNEYANDLYKEHLPSQRGASTFNFETDLTIGVHYKF